MKEDFFNEEEVEEEVEEADKPSSAKSKKKQKVSQKKLYKVVLVAPDYIVIYFDGNNKWMDRPSDTEDLSIGDEISL